MKRLTRVAFALAVMSAAAVVIAAAYGAVQDEGEVEFAEVRIFFEYNSSDDDLGVQVFLDGKPWKRLKISDPKGKTLLEMTAKGSLGKLGLTELFWESAEPSPEEVLALFKSGEYEFEGRTVDGKEIEGEAVLSHELPDPPVIVSPDEDEAVDSENFVIEWESDPDIASYEIIVESEETGVSMSVPLPASATTLHVPAEFLDPGTEYKFEIIAIGENGNKTISERVFTTE